MKWRRCSGITVGDAVLPCYRIVEEANGFGLFIYPDRLSKSDPAIWFDTAEQAEGYAEDHLISAIKELLGEQIGS